MKEQSGPAAGKTWSSRTVFILSAVGAAVGLGNLWRFPYLAGEYGGGAFVLVYLACLLAFGMPLLAAELFIGRRGRGSVVASVVRLARAEGRSPLWALQSWIAVIGAFIILTFYSVIAGWVVAYVVMFAGGLFSSISSDGIAAGAFAGESPDAVLAKLTALLNDPVGMIVYLALFLALTVLIVSRGLKGGIETANTIMMPAFFVMLVFLGIYALVGGDAGKGLDFVFGVRLDDRTLDNGDVFRGLWHGLADGSVISAALGQIFFSMGIGSALMMTYAAYVSEDQDLPSATRAIALSDTAAGILAAVAIFPIVFHAGLDPAGGPTLMFQTLPLAFHNMPGGAIFGLVFFILALFAALTSSIAVLEATTRWVDEQRAGDQRVIAAIILGLATFLIGVLNALSQVPAIGADGADQSNFFNTWRPLDSVPAFKGLVLLDLLIRLTDIMLPIAGFITAIFAGWIVSAATSREELGFKSEAWYQRWRFLVRYVCPAGIAFIIIYGAFLAPYLAEAQARQACDAARAEIAANGPNDALSAAITGCDAGGS